MVNAPWEMGIGFQNKDRGALAFSQLTQTEPANDATPTEFPTSHTAEDRLVQTPTAESIEKRFRFTLSMVTVETH